MKTIGFIGFGHMGSPMACNLVKKGFQVKGYDINSEALREFEAAGGTLCQSLVDVAVEVDCIITMLQTATQVQAVCLNEEGVYAKAKEGALHIDCSSIDVQSSRELQKRGRESGLLTLDAPVSGGVAGAGAATLTFMVGGSRALFELATPVLKAMGQTLIHTGDTGSGQVAKICNNMILGISMIAVSEAFILGKKLGLSPEKLFEVVNHASGQCWVMSKYPPYPHLLAAAPSSKQYKPGFTANMMLKDLSLSQKAAEAAQLTTTIAAKAQQLYQELVDAGQGELDFSAIIQTLDPSLKDV